MKMFIAFSHQVAIHNKNGKGLLPGLQKIYILKDGFVAIHNKNGKGLLHFEFDANEFKFVVAIHNKNGKGLLPKIPNSSADVFCVAIHNKNGKGLLRKKGLLTNSPTIVSQSTIKMEKGYYEGYSQSMFKYHRTSQSTIKMEKGYYQDKLRNTGALKAVAIHNKNGKGLLLDVTFTSSNNIVAVAIHNKNGKGLLLL